MTFRLSPNSPKSGAFGDRALQPHCSRLSFHSLLIARCSPTLRRVRGPRPTTSLPSPLFSLIARCSLLAHLTARSGTAPYNLIARVPRWRGGQGEVTLSLSKGCPAERLKTVPYSLIAHCSLLIAHCYSFPLAHGLFFLFSLNLNYLTT